MAIVDIIMPKMGESIMEASILRWYKKVGEHIKIDEALLDVATDKVDTEIPSMVEGVVTEILYNVNDVVPVGAVLARVQQEGIGTIHAAHTESLQVPATPPVETVMHFSQASSEPVAVPHVEPIVDVPYTPSHTFIPNKNTPANNRFFSPLVLNIANSEGLSLSELENLPGTGAENRVTKKDILQYIADKRSGKVQAFASFTPQRPIYTTPPVVESAPVQQANTVVEPIITHHEPTPAPAFAPAPVHSEPVVAPTAQHSFEASSNVNAAIPLVEIPNIDIPQYEAPKVETPIVETPHFDAPTIQAHDNEEHSTVTNTVLGTIAGAAGIATGIAAVEHFTHPQHQENIPPTVAGTIDTIEEKVIEPLAPVAKKEGIHVSMPAATFPLNHSEPAHTNTEVVAPTDEVSPIVETSTSASVSEKTEDILTHSPLVEDHPAPLHVPHSEDIALHHSEFDEPVVSPELYNESVTPLDTNSLSTTESIPSEVENATVPVEKGNVAIVEMDRMRKLIAKHMIDSKNTSAHVTSFAEADVTHFVAWREQVKHKFEAQEGIKLTYTPMIIECIVKVLKRYPIINSSVEGDNIIIKHDLNIGVATALPNGNLIVPVIKNTESKSLSDIAAEVNTLSTNARNNKLKPDDTFGGTFTFTNVGTFGTLMGTPIINQPQVAILAAGTIKKRPVVVETNMGDFVAIRHMMYLSLSYDHRIIDGSTGATFLSEVVKELERWDTNKTV